jgi:hypothetical protein
MGNSNIITITEKTNYKKDDVIKYKTPKQVENETANYKINSLIVLNPDNTIIDGMYYIYDEATGTSKQKKAQMLAQKNELQLITIDISNYQTNK